MKTHNKVFRLTDSENKKIKQLSRKNGMNESDYIKSKLFDQNSDLIEEDEKFTAPYIDKQGYFFAFSLVKLNLVLQEMMSKQGYMNHTGYEDFCKKNTPKIREILSNLGFNKIVKKDE